MTARSRLLPRPAVTVPLVAALAGVPLLLSAPAAWADPGDIKVHAQGTPFADQANNPKPGCQFYIAAFGVTAGQTYRVTFTPQPANGNGPAGKPTTASDTYTATLNLSKNGKKGDGRSRLFNPDPAHPEITTGQYKVTAANVNDPHDAKTKVFRVDCPATSGGGSSGSAGGPNGGSNGNNGGVGGVGNPDTGQNPVGGVNTGGGFLAADNGGGTDALPWVLLGGAGIAGAAFGARKLRK